MIVSRCGLQFVAPFPVLFEVFHNSTKASHFVHAQNKYLAFFNYWLSLVLPLLRVLHQPLFICVC